MMKMKSITLISLGIIVAVMLIFGQVGPQVYANHAGLEPGTTEIPLSDHFIPPIPSLFNTTWLTGQNQSPSLREAIAWDESEVAYAPETGVWVGVYNDWTAQFPKPNDVFYIKVDAYTVYDGFQSPYVYFEFALPANTNFAISSTYRFFCDFWNGSTWTRYEAGTPGCPSQFVPDPSNPGFYIIKSGDSSAGNMYALAYGCALSFKIPVSSPVSYLGGTLRGKFHVISSNGGSYWRNPSLNRINVWPASTPKPGAFNKSAPVNGAKNQPRNLTLSWGTSANAASYEYCLDKTAGTTCTDSWKSTGTNKSVALSGLTSGVYYWQVNAKNASGSTQANAGTWWSFTVPPKPGAFTKTLPANNAINRPTNPVLSWGASANAAKYEYCIDKVNDGKCNTSWISTGTNRSKALSGLTRGTKYFWQVRSRNAVGTTIANNGTWWNFTVVP